MTVKELIKEDFINVITPSVSFDRCISGCIACDLLSHAMSHAESGNAWITVLGHINVVAVAQRRDIACVILADGALLSDDAEKAANKHGICVLSSKKSTCELAAVIYNKLKNE